jgi:hypothetical protein
MNVKKLIVITDFESEYDFDCIGIANKILNCSSHEDFLVIGGLNYFENE